MTTNTAGTIGYGGQGAVLNLNKSPFTEDYCHDDNNRYWKIAVTLPDLDLAYVQLREKGISVTAPHQFRDIAYMCHLKDPEGHIIELIQHSFQGNPRTAKGRKDVPLGGGAQLGLITLRTGDIVREIACCENELRMRYLSRQAVTDLGFDLHFFGFGDDTPPKADINAIENREWLWQRPYTVLEFQHRPKAAIFQPPEHTNGAATIGILHANGTQSSFR